MKKAPTIPIAKLGSEHGTISSVAGASPLRYFGQLPLKSKYYWLSRTSQYPVLADNFNNISRGYMFNLTLKTLQVDGDYLYIHSVSF